MKTADVPRPAWCTYPGWSECWSARWWRACWDCWGLSVWQEKCLPWHEWLIFWKKRRIKDKRQLWIMGWTWSEAGRQTEPIRCRKTEKSTFTDKLVSPNVLLMPLTVHRVNAVSNSLTKPAVWGELHLSLKDCLHHRTLNRTRGREQNSR